MKNAAIISIGTEIMRGKIDDTNSTFISRWLKDCGIFLKYRLNVADDTKEIVKSIDFVKDSDLIIFTGGLGPTDDDITRETVANYLNKKLVFIKESWDKIEEIFKKRKFVMAKSNDRQAFCIEGGEHIPNDNGTAPGIFYSDSSKIYVLLPGPPHENIPMINGWLTAKLKEIGFIDGEIYTKIFRLYNVGESVIADVFSDFKENIKNEFNEDIEVGYYFTKNSYVEIHLSKFITNDKEKSTILKIAEGSEKLFIDNNFVYTSDESLTALVLKLLTRLKKSLSFAESITGGNLSGEFVKNPNASSVLNGGVVVYSNLLKQKLLGVREETLKEFGPYSKECVKEMCYGLKEITKSDINISISGIAGPDNVSLEKPAGLVYFGFLFDDELIIKKEIFNYDNRERIINRCINYVYYEIFNYYKDR